MNCPSTHCQNNLDENARHCGICGLDLSLHKDEIKARDEMLMMFNEFLTKHGKESIKMVDLDSFFKYNGARFSMLFMEKSLDMVEKIAREKRSPQLKPKGLYGLFWERLAELDKDHEGLIKMPVLHTKLCRSFSLKKIECKEILLLLRDFGMLEFKKRGIRLLNSDFIKT
jgi:hypothetical protein